MSSNDFMTGLMVMWAGAMFAAIFLTEPEPAPVTAIEARLLAKCSGKIYAAYDEDQLPLRCEWVEQINFKG